LIRFFFVADWQQSVEKENRSAAFEVETDFTTRSPYEINPSAMTGIFSGGTVFSYKRAYGACTGGIYLGLWGAWVIRACRISCTACMVTRAVSVVVETATSRDTVSQVID